MEITEVKVFPIQEEKLKAFVSVVFDQCFMVNDIKIIQGREGLFISMPSRKRKNGEFKDVAHPLNNETRRMIEEKILGEYERVLGERGEKLPAPPLAAFLGAAAPASGTPPGIEAAPRISLPPRPTLVSPVPPALQNPQTAPMPMPMPSAAPGPQLVAVGQLGAPVAAAAALPPPPPPSAPAAADGAAREAQAAAAAVPPPAAPVSEKTLDEIEEMHLRDSFWTVT